MIKKEIIAVIWDFDKTLIPGNMQEPLFKKYNVDPLSFWEEVDNLSNFYKKEGIDINQETIYLNHIITYIKEGIFYGLSNSMLKQLGKELTFNPGLPQLFQYIKNHMYHEFGDSIVVEHYVISTGLKAMISGSAIAPYIDGYWGSEFIEIPAPPGYLKNNLSKHETLVTINQIGYAFDNNSKTKALFEINKGVNKGFVPNVNTPVEKGKRRVQFNNMIYIADGESDIPAFSLVKSMGGSAFGVYPRENENVYNTLLKLSKEKRVEHIGEADFTLGSNTSKWLLNKIDERARNISLEYIVNKR